MEPNNDVETEAGAAPPATQRKSSSPRPSSKRCPSTACAGSTELHGRSDKPRSVLHGRSDKPRSVLMVARTSLAPRVFDPTRGWRLHPQVAVRPEPFGALLYHFGTRKLSFLKDRTILAIVQSLDEHRRRPRRLPGRRGDGGR